MLSLSCEAAGEAAGKTLGEEVGEEAGYQAVEQCLAVSTEVVEVAVWRLPLPGGIPLELVKIPAWEGLIGSTAAEAGRDGYGNRPECEGNDVEAQRWVTLTEFAIARYPISQEQWNAVAMLEIQKFEIPLDPASTKGKNLPVEMVTWWEVSEWCARLNFYLVDKLGEGSLQVMLPSECQWEVACRAGSSSPFHFGATIDSTWANYDSNYIYGGGKKGRFLNKASAVGDYGLVNPWGLADMHGNVWEWCADLWHPSLLGAPRDGRAWLEPAADYSEVHPKRRLLRGGCWSSYPVSCRAAYRNSMHLDLRNSYVGFRVCCPAPAIS